MLLKVWWIHTCILYQLWYIHESFCFNGSKNILGGFLIHLETVISIIKCLEIEFKAFGECRSRRLYCKCKTCHLFVEIPPSKEDAKDSIWFYLFPYRLNKNCVTLCYTDAIMWQKWLFCFFVADERGCLLKCSYFNLNIDIICTQTLSNQYLKKESKMLCFNFFNNQMVKLFIKKLLCHFNHKITNLPLGLESIKIKSS